MGEVEGEGGAGGGLVGEGRRGGWEGGSPGATGPLLPSNSPHFAFPRPNLPLLLLSLSPSHPFSVFPQFLLLKPKNIPPSSKPLPPPNFSHLQNIQVPCRSRLHLSSSLPSNSRHFAFPRALLDAGGEGGWLPSVFPRCTAPLFYGTCIYHCDHSCAGVVQEPRIIVICIFLIF